MAGSRCALGSFIRGRGVVPDRDIPSKHANNTHDRKSRLVLGVSGTRLSPMIFTGPLLQFSRGKPACRLNYLSTPKVGSSHRI